MTIMLALLLAAAAQAPAPPPQPAMLFRCRERIDNFEGTSGALSLDKSFREDGTPLGLNVQLEDRSGSVMPGRGPTEQTGMTLSWPGRHRVAIRPEPFSWSNGGIDVYYSGPTNRYVYRRDERWRRVIVDRAGSMIVHESDGARWIFVSGLDLYLMSNLQDLGSPGRLWMSLDGLLAWGSGRERVTVYETVITERRERNQGPALGQERIVGQYDIDIPALARLAARVRAATEAWEAGLTDLAARCTREPEETGEIIVTSGG